MHIAAQAALTAGVVLASALAVAAPVPAAPALVLVIVVDQLRYEDLPRLRSLTGPGGLGGLEARGVLLDGRHRTLATETGPGHATLSTGAYSNEHGVVANVLRRDGKRVAVAEDPTAPTWGAAEPSKGRSPRVLRVPTVGDQLKLSTLGRGHVVAVAGKDRSAVLAGGFGADLALWWDPDQAQFTSSSYYAEAPPPWLVRFNAAHGPAELARFRWEPLRPRADYARLARPDDAPGEGSAYGLGTTLPKVLGSVAPEKLGTAVRATPLLDVWTLEAALAAAEAFQLGADADPDLLWVSLSGFDIVGHNFGTDGVERVDAYVRLDAQLRRFLQALETRVGAGKLAVILTADHGLTPIPEQSLALRLPAGRTDMPATTAAVDAALDRLVSPQDWVQLFVPPNIYLRPAPDGRPLPCPVLQEAARAAAAVPGVGHALARCELATLSGPEWEDWHHALDPERSGEILLEPRPLWVWRDDEERPAGTDHSSTHVTNQRVPLLVVAPGYQVPAPFREEPVDMRRVAPTLSTLLQTTPPPAAHLGPVVVRAP